MNKAQQAQALVTLYMSLYKKTYGHDPVVNRYRLKWGMTDVIDSVGYQHARALMEYYFDCDAEHTPEWFLNNFDRLDASKKEQDIDDERRRRLREETKRRMQSLEQ